jgi:hypothetical protein
MSRGSEQVLTPTVEQTALQVIEQAKLPSQLIVVEGLSGVGKTALANHITPKIEAAGGLVVSQQQIEQKTVEGDTTEGPVVVTITMTTAKGSNRRSLHGSISDLFPGREVNDLILPGMPDHETGDFVAKLPKGSLEPELIAYYSMGVPLLAQRFSQASSTDQIERAGMTYIRQATKYNVQAVRHIAASFLQMPVPTEFMPGASTVGRQIYQSLQQAERVRAKLDKQGAIEESSLFVAPESERVYNAMLQSEDGMSEIEIFIPGMSVEDFARVQQALGWDSSRKTYDEEKGPCVGDYRQDKSPRAKMFEAYFRKLSFWHKTPDGTEYQMNNEFGNGRISAVIESYQEALASGQLGLSGEPQGNNSGMWLHSHEHNGMPEHTARFGWMVESLLQQRGIAYFVNNETSDMSYAYLPEEQRLQILADRVKIDRYRS